MTIDLLAAGLAFAAVFFISFAKGALGGGFALIGIPLLALAMDPFQGGILLAVMFVVMDVVTLCVWRPSNWSYRDMKMLIPPLAAGTGLGYVLMSRVPQAIVEILISIVVLMIAALTWYRTRQPVIDDTPLPRSWFSAIIAGMTSGLASMLAHSGGLPLTLYLLRQRMPKAMHAGTASIIFAFSDLLKLGPWLALAPPEKPTITLMFLCVPAVLLGVWSGWKVHNRLNQLQFIRTCMILVVLAAFKLLWDGISSI